jgi:hypothetical protein
METLEPIHTKPAHVLVGILATDRDVRLVERVHTGLTSLSNHCSWQIVVVARETDRSTRDAWGQLGAEVLTVPDYDVGASHDFWKIAEKRNRLCRLAQEREADALLFVDSDIVIDEVVAREMLAGAMYADVVVVPGRMRWNHQFTVGIMEQGRLRFCDVRELGDHGAYPRIVGGGMGCTLIRLRALDVPFTPMQVNGVPGEDVGFFYEILTNRPELVVRCTAWPNVATHLY